MDRFDAMRVFVRVVETGSFTKSAESLGISKTTATQLIQQLEARLRVKLLNRTTRKVNVTADGAAYYERVVRLLADMDDAETSLSSASVSPRGRLRVDVPSPLASMLLIPALPEFQDLYPEIQLDMGVSDRVVNMIAEGGDCVVRGGEISDLSLVARRVGDLRLGMYAAPRYLKRFGTPEHPRELEGPRHCIVGFTGGSAGAALPCVMQGKGERIKVQGYHRISVDDGNAYLAAGLAGVGVLWLPDYMAREPLSQGRLVSLLIDWHLDPMPLYIAFPPNRYVSAKLRVFMDWVAGLIARHAPVMGRKPGR